MRCSRMCISANKKGVLKSIGQNLLTKSSSYAEGRNSDGPRQRDHQHAHQAGKTAGEYVVQNRMRRVTEHADLKN